MDPENLGILDYVTLTGIIITAIGILVTAVIGVRRRRGEKKNEASETRVNELKAVNELAEIYERLQRLNNDLEVERDKRENLERGLEAERGARIADRALFEAEISRERKARLVVEDDLQSVKLWAEMLVAQLVNAKITPALFHPNEP